MASKKTYMKPEINVVNIDNSISLVMMTHVPPNPMMPRGSSNKGTDTPFTSPFDEKPFS
ncbi:MAG: hypothetical protein IPI69_03690 [Bacteroidales bacterium]|jgi:hypothetical protein|nr:hypothetical protein [Bacteroidales bacterium]MDI9553538.1 hypothetical protein [Bacteroidota bacterium]